MDDLVREPGERATYLKRVYRKERFKKPRNALGLQKDLPPAEMEKLILANIAVGPDELKELGLRRAQAVRNFFLTGGKVEPGRLFLVDPSPAAADEKDVPGSRVDFALK